MYPTIVRVGSLAVRSYGVALAAAVLVTVWLVEREAKRNGIEGYKVFDLAVVILLVSIAGARVMYGIQHWSDYRHDPLRLVMVWEGGLIFLGGLIPGIVVGLIYLKLKGIWFLRDTIALYLPIGIAITRVGCFLNGCCFGKPTDCPIGVRFPPSSVAGSEFLDSVLGVPGPLLGFQIWCGLAKVLRTGSVLLISHDQSVDIYHRGIHVCRVASQSLFLPQVRDSRDPDPAVLAFRSPEASRACPGKP